MRSVFRSVNVRKATVPDGIPGRVLVSSELSGAFTKIFNFSQAQASVEACLKSATIVPVLKKHNDYRHTALTPVVTECFQTGGTTHQ